MTCRAPMGVAVVLASISLSWAADLDLSKTKPQTAQVVTLARLGSVLCPDLDLDEGVVHELMGKAGITDKDLVDPSAYGANDMIVARSFAHSYLGDPANSCVQIFAALGPGAGQLLHRGGRPI